MAVTSGFFNSINGDRKYNARQIGMYLGKIIRSGVFSNPSTNLQVTAAGGMAVQVWPGRGMANCHWIDNDSMYTVILDDADLILDRIDAVVMRLDESDDAREVSVAVKKGSPASSPEAPAMERTEKVEEYCLAQIYVPKIKDDGTQEILQANITDTRADTDVCGWVTSLIEQVDTHTLFLQWQDAYQRYYDESTEAFETWLDGIKAQLGKDVVSTILNQIDGLVKRADGIDTWAMETDAEIQRIGDETEANTEDLKTLESAVQDMGEDQKNLEGEVAQIKEDLKTKEGNPSVLSMIIPVSGWKGDNAPYTNTLEIDRVKPTSVVEISLSQDANADQVRACMNGQLVDGGQTAGNITLRAFGRKPDMDIPVVVIIRGNA